MQHTSFKSMGDWECCDKHMVVELSGTAEILLQVFFYIYFCCCFLGTLFNLFLFFSVYLLLGLLPKVYQSRIDKFWYKMTVPYQKHT